MKTLTFDDIDSSIAAKIYTQDYSKKDTIEEVKTIPLHNHVNEDGDFCELMCFNDQGELEDLSFFKPAQINRTKLHPRVLKAWHVHFKQDEIWYVAPSSYLFVGLWDIRKQSATKGKILRMVLGGGKSELLVIPRGVAHGVYNISENPVDLFYVVNQRFDREHPDEHRLSWDALSQEFWSPKRD